MFTITLFSEEEREKLIRKYGTENAGLEWVYSPETYPVKSMRRYLEGDKYGVYKKNGIKIPFFLKREYRKAREAREKKIFTEFYHLHTNVRFGKKREYFMFDYRIEKISETDMMKMIKLLGKG